MSISVMTRVWRESSRQGNELLLLLALADHADDDGVCWPGIALLARKSRNSERHVKRLLVKLEHAGELYVRDRRGGRGRSNRYLLTVGFTGDELREILERRFALMPLAAAAAAAAIQERRGPGEKGDIPGQGVTPGPKGDIPGQKGDIPGQRVTPRPKGDIPGQKGDTAQSPEPSEPSPGKPAAEPSEPSPARVSKQLDEFFGDDTHDAPAGAPRKLTHPKNVRIAEHLAAGLEMPLPGNGNLRRNFLSAARDLLDATNGADIDGVCAAIDAWFASDDPWARKVTAPRGAVQSIARHYHRSSRPRRDDFVSGKYGHLILH